MNFVSQALKTESKVNELKIGPRSTIALVELCIASANIADTFKKHIYYGKEIDAEAAYEEFERLVNFGTRLMSDIKNSAVDDEEFLYTDMLEGMSDQAIEFINEQAQKAKKSLNTRLLHASLGIFTEAGEMLQALTKANKENGLDMVNFAEETGDVDWYKAIIHDETGVSEEVTRAAVIAKLKKRFGDKFETEKALNRDLEGEREVLEENLR